MDPVSTDKKGLGNFVMKRSFGYKQDYFSTEWRQSKKFQTIVLDISN